MYLVGKVVGAGERAQARDPVIPKGCCGTRVSACLQPVVLPPLLSPPRAGAGPERSALLGAGWTGKGGERRRGLWGYCA